MYCKIFCRYIHAVNLSLSSCTSQSQIQCQSSLPYCGLTSRCRCCEAAERKRSASGRRRRSSRIPAAATGTDYRQEQRTIDGHALCAYISSSSSSTCVTSAMSDGLTDWLTDWSTVSSFHRNRCAVRKLFREVTIDLLLLLHLSSSLLSSQFCIDLLRVTLVRCIIN